MPVRHAFSYRDAGLKCFFVLELYVPTQFNIVSLIIQLGLISIDAMLRNVHLSDISFNLNKINEFCREQKHYL